MVWTRTNVAGTVLAAMADYRKEVGARIRTLRTARHLSQEDLAHAAGVTVKTISRWENGKHSGYLDNVKSLAEALEVDPEEITGRPPTPLGLGADVPSQRPDVDRLDRIEQRLAAIEKHLAATDKSIQGQLKMQDGLNDIRDAVDVLHQVKVELSGRGKAPARKTRAQQPAAPPTPLPGSQARKPKPPKRAPKAS